MILIFILAAALMLSLAGCTFLPAANEPAATSEPTAPADHDNYPAPAATEVPTSQAEHETTQELKPAVERQDGDRFDGTITFQGMESTVPYEYLKRDDLGFGMAYAYESFDRESDADKERFVSKWDDPDVPENYIDVVYDPSNSNLMRDYYNATLSELYDVTEVDTTLDNGVECIRMEGSVLKGTNQMDDHITVVYIIPANDGCRIATEHCVTVDSEGFLKQCDAMIKSISVFDANREVAEEPISDDFAVSMIKGYCLYEFPDLAEISEREDVTVYWQIDEEKSDDQTAVVLYRSYTGSETRYYVDRLTGDVHVTEFMPGIHTEEQSTDVTFSVWDYIG